MVKTPRAESREEAVERALRALRGEDRDGAVAVAINAAFALYVAGAVRDFREGYEIATAVIEEGLPIGN